MTEFEETAFESIVDKIVVKSQHELEFHLIGGLKFEEKYSQTALQVKSQGSFLLLLVIAFEKKMWYCCRSKGGEIMAKNRTIPFGYCMKTVR